MHKSQLAGIMIDCKTDDLDRAADFWAAALGLKREAADTPATTSYVHMQRKDPSDLNIDVQRVDHESRIHLDIETDNVESEVARLQKLGARKVKQCDGWCVLEAPTGQRFCVVVPKHAHFAKRANIWE